MSAADVQKLGPEHHILKGNVKRNKFRGVVWTMFGQVIPLDKDDKVIKPVPLKETPLWKKMVKKA